MQTAGGDIFADKWLDLYKEICMNIRTTDDISFKLLGLVPTVAGVSAGALTLLEKIGPLKTGSSWVIVALAMVGFVVTFGLFRWELRNAQKCNWLIQRAAGLEQYALAHNTDVRFNIQYDGWEYEERPRLRWRWPWGKTEAEAAVYISSMAVWSIPAIVALGR